MGWESGRGMSLRLGAGKVPHVDTQRLWVQGSFHRRDATIRKSTGIRNEADLLTKFSDGQKMQEIVQHMHGIPLQRMTNRSQPSVQRRVT